MDKGQRQSIWEESLSFNNNLGTVNCDIYIYIINHVGAEMIPWLLVNTEY